MAKKIEGGWLNGNVVRRARKAYRCVNARAAERGNPDAAGCLLTIMAGTYYAEVECNPYEAGGFGMDKACMHCAGPEARSLIYAPGVWERRAA